MNTTTSSNTPVTGTTSLTPSYNIPLVLVALAIPLLLIQRWLSLPIAIFGLFLTYQAATLRLEFTPTDLDIYRNKQLIRRFPFAEWQNWQVFWQPVPILFYFKEVKSIHFLPILFDPQTLISCCQQRFPKN